MRTFSFCAMRLRMLVGGVGAITMCPAPSLTGVVYALIPDTTDDASGRPRLAPRIVEFCSSAVCWSLQLEPPVSPGKANRQIASEGEETGR